MLDGVQIVEHALHEHEAVVLALISMVALLAHVLIDVFDRDVVTLRLRGAQLCAG